MGIDTGPHVFCDIPSNACHLSNCHRSKIGVSVIRVDANQSIGNAMTPSYRLTMHVSVKMQNCDTLEIMQNSGSCAHSKVRR